MRYREKEKSEMKDRKVLEILNAKDDKIDELQKLVGNQSKELSEAILVYVRRRKHYGAFLRILSYSLFVLILVLLHLLVRAIHSPQGISLISSQQSLPTSWINLLHNIY